jgi:hypothetical protein
MTIRNVQRISLGAGVSGFSFDSGLTSPDASVAISAQPENAIFGTSKITAWAELEKDTLEGLIRRRKIGFADATKIKL